MSQSSQTLPEAAMPQVFSRDGRRLFIIDGEARVADEDLAKDLQWPVTGTSGRA